MKLSNLNAAWLKVVKIKRWGGGNLFKKIVLRDQFIIQLNQIQENTIYILFFILEFLAKDLKN